MLSDAGSTPAASTISRQKLLTIQGDYLGEVFPFVVMGQIWGNSSKVRAELFRKRAAVGMGQVRDVPVVALLDHS
jgi:hypothetical protein